MPSQVDQEVIEKLADQAKNDALNQKWDNYSSTLKELAVNLMRGDENYNSAIMEGKDNEVGRTVLSSAMGVVLGRIKGKVEVAIPDREDAVEHKDEIMQKMNEFEDNMNDPNSAFVRELDQGVRAVIGPVDSQAELDMVATPKPENKGKKDEDDLEYDSPGLR